jgi:hypothetical protein
MLELLQRYHKPKQVENQTHQVNSGLGEAGRLRHSAFLFGYARAFFNVRWFSFYYLRVCICALIRFLYLVDIL